MSTESGRKRPSPELIAARRIEVSKRYRAMAKKRHKRPLTFAAIRAAELTRLYDHRYGPVLIPETDQGMVAARIMVHHLARLRDAPRRITAWMATCAPWL